MDRFIVTIIDREACPKHKRPVGIPCFLLRKHHGFGYYAGVCNKRAKRAGFNGKISAKALLGKKTA